MSLTDPDRLPDRRLDPVRRHAILDEILAAPPARSAGRPWLLPAAAAAAVGVIAAAGVALTGDDGAPRPARDRTAPIADADPAEPVEAVVPFTLEALPAKEERRLVEECARSFGERPDGFEAALAQRVDALDGDDRVVIAEQPATGTTLFCNSTGGAKIAGPSSKALVVEPTADEPVTRADGGGIGVVTPRQGTDLDLHTTATFRVGPGVARVEMRVGTDAAPGTWHRSTPEGGYAYAGAWLDAGVPEDTPVFLETRAYDAAGRPLTAAALGRERLQPPQPLPPGPSGSAP